MAVWQFGDEWLQPTAGSLTAVSDKKNTDTEKPRNFSPIARIIRHIEHMWLRVALFYNRMSQRLKKQMKLGLPHNMQDKDLLNRWKMNSFNGMNLCYSCCRAAWHKCFPRGS